MGRQSPSQAWLSRKPAGIYETPSGAASLARLIVANGMDAVASVGKSGGRPVQPVTTVLLRNIPKDYTQEELLAELDPMGVITQTLDFFCLMRRGAVSDACINFVTPEHAKAFGIAFWQYRFQRHKAARLGSVRKMHLQGQLNILCALATQVLTGYRTDCRPWVFHGDWVDFGELLAELKLLTPRLGEAGGAGVPRQPPWAAERAIRANPPGVPITPEPPGVWPAAPMVLAFQQEAAGEPAGASERLPDGLGSQAVATRPSDACLQEALQLQAATAGAQFPLHELLAAADERGPVRPPPGLEDVVPVATTAWGALQNALGAKRTGSLADLRGALAEPKLSEPEQEDGSTSLGSASSSSSAPRDRRGSDPALLCSLKHLQGPGPARS